MANISKAHLFDKDIRNLKAKDKRYKVAVGSPKELYLFVHPSGTKTFFLRLAGDKIVGLKEFRPGIYSVVEARRDANALLAQLAQGKELDVILGKSDKYKFKNLFDKFIEQKRKQNKESTIVRTIRTVSTYILPKFGDRDVKDIKRSELLEVFNTIFNPNNPSKSRLETLRRLINHCKNVFNIAIKDRYIDYNPCFDLEKEFPTTYIFNHTHGIDTRYPALT